MLTQEIEDLIERVLATSRQLQIDPVDTIASLAAFLEYQGLDEPTAAQIARERVGGTLH